MSINRCYAEAWDGSLCHNPVGKNAHVLDRCHRHGGPYVPHYVGLFLAGSSVAEVAGELAKERKIQGLPFTMELLTIEVERWIRAHNERMMKR